MTLKDTSAIVPQWRTVRCEMLDRDIQVRRITVGDVGLPTHEMWLKLCRDGDGTALLPLGTRGGDVDPALVEEVCKLAMGNPTPAGA